MATQNRAGYKLPTKPEERGGNVAQGFTTPKQDRTPQVQSIPPKRVIPIIFIPGIMGSNLRMNAARQAEMKKENNMAWRPDDISETVPIANDSAAERQLRFDPFTTELDVYDPATNITGNASETSDMRHGHIHFTGKYGGSLKRIDGPLLQPDRAGSPQAKTRDQKSRERGWGEIFFGSYEEILSACEIRLNGALSDRFKDPYLMNSIIDINPLEWGAHPNPLLRQIDEATLRAAVKGCWFPVHAMGYNWLRGNRESGVETAERVKLLIKNYLEQGYQCEKVILLTHSMGGLVARAMIHPGMGNISEKVLGVIHGVMPAIGAGTAYKRMRCGFEGDDTPAKILGAVGSHVTPVLGNSQGGLELLPNQAYGNHWLQLMHNGKLLMSYPENGDPYKEIYKEDKKWFGLLRKDWLNPAGLKGVGLERSYDLLDRAKKFHNQISETFHQDSYAHYGADPAGLAWHKVRWEINGDMLPSDVESLRILSDDEKGNLQLGIPIGSSRNSREKKIFTCTLQPPADPGDQTVPVYSADAQLRSGKFKGVFRQIGYEHQASYSNDAVIASTIYCLYQIILTMKWSSK